MKRTVVLASASKRRSQILSSCGIRHRIIVSGTRETLDKTSGIEKTVIENAKRKAAAVAQRYDDAVIIGADTLVRTGRYVVGKPKTKKEAKRLLGHFSGKTIEVYTGLCVIDTASGRQASACDKSLIYVRKIAKSDMARHLDTLRPYDKAGGFSIEGAGSIIFDNISGSYFNILGLPMAKLAVLFKKAGLRLLDFIGK